MSHRFPTTLLSAALLVSLGLAGCAVAPTATPGAVAAQRPPIIPPSTPSDPVWMGTVLAVQTFEVGPATTYLGMVGGAVAGEQIGAHIGQGHGRTVAKILGAAVGGAAGSAAEQAALSHAEEYVSVHLDAGPSYRIEQPVTYALAPGQRVAVLHLIRGANPARVVPAPAP